MVDDAAASSTRRGPGTYTGACVGDMRQEDHPLNLDPPIRAGFAASLPRRCRGKGEFEGDGRVIAEGSFGGRACPRWRSAICRMSALVMPSVVAPHRRQAATRGRAQAPAVA